MSESVPVIPTNAIPPFPPSFTDPTLLLHALNTANPVQDMHPRSSKPSTPRPETADSTSSGHQRSPEVGRPLNVTDALSYLDAVKNQFHESPDVYNQFLDIMKDFKSQVIDTPGVIQRVSRLFHGNPYLIQGFNTFLPMGYRIDIAVDPSDPNIITVTTPLGTTTQNTNNTAPIPRNARELDPMLPAPAYVNAGPGPYPITSTLLQNTANGPGSRSHTPHLFPTPTGPPPPYEPVYSPGIQGPQTTAAAASFLNYLNNNNNNNVNNVAGSSSKQVEKQPAGEFNHAIQYLNKIKARYGDDPNTYKQFLDILQTFQKEQRHSPDAQVYVQVQMLFKDAPDLLAEFKDFLPEAMPGSMGPNGVHIMPQSSTTSWGPGESSPPHTQVKKPTQAPKRSRKRVPEKEATPVPPSKPAPSRQPKKVKHSHNPDNEPAPFASYPVPLSPSQSHAYPVAQGPPPIHSHAGPHGVHHLSDYQSNTSPGKLLFFDRAKKSLESQEYDEFLKLLSLFSKDIIDLQTLIERANVFLGEGDLMTDFKDLVGYDDRDKVERGPPGSIRTGPPELPTALPVDDGEGPSYRKLPPSETQLACSGRDELCRSVLNDEWVSHPTWASEESGFVAHKKTPFEEAVHRSEEERHEYHVQIEALVRTIAVLEPLNSRIDEMTNEERSHFRLKPDFGGSGMSIYHRIIKKIYGKDMGLEVIQALQDCPSVAVPVVLNRLKAKDEEWRRAQREWSRTWKEVDCKNFYKSLDHQGTNFKQNDKKNITAKYFVTDIQSIKKQQLKKWERKGVKAFTQGTVGHQLEYSFKNTAVLHDAVKMVYTFLEHNHAQYSPPERRGVEKFLRAFIPTLCMSSEAEFWATVPLDGTAGSGASAEEDAGHDVNKQQPEGSRSGRRSTGSGGQGHSTPIPANDLRKKLLKTAQEKVSANKRGGASVSGSRAESPSASGHGSPRPGRTDDDSSDPHDIWIKESGVKSTMDNVVSPSDKERPYFVNTTFYTLIRLFEIGAQYAAQKHASLLANRVAVDLGLDDPNGPASVLKQTIDHLGKPAAEDTNIVYMYLLTACEKMFDNELDQGTFEEHMRWFFGTKAYTLFTLDKSIIALIKQVQTILGDNKCQELWSLLKSAQSSKNISTQDIIRYRREAERHVGQDDHLYRLQWVRETRCIRVSLCSANEPSVETDGSELARWREYVNTYVMTHPTEWLPEGKKESSPVFLRRCVRVGEERRSTASVVEDRIKIRVSYPRYKLVYEAGCEDLVVQRQSSELRGRARQREEERRKCELLS
ncbi:Transcriptional regulatory protein SIN3 [Psilocybe cubensis]|nr:Transcriptional regulatory protein SIN3 [Psilocybe cubensis]KAH9486320.1 Transcriptional regulatory protein SIN3 [Psilocybe cubensis]